MVLCSCSNVAIIKTSWTDQNLERRFSCCPNVGSDCGTFRWIDPPMCQRSIEIILGLLRARNTLEEDIEEYLQMYREQQELVVQLRIYWVISGSRMVVNVTIGEVEAVFGVCVEDKELSV
ncbi:zinc finger, GRF-type [Artemisia annua]|uniref:Zinc finger, GRF-type n=1 Tax=Artemisia annua TaxID=35608 RepID=A0A2U1P4J7_ARTAN|nr:zinc finger, GRF-type [Artemisia annua]